MCTGECAPMCTFNVEGCVWAVVMVQSQAWPSLRLVFHLSVQERRGLTWQGRGMGAVPGKSWNWTVGLHVSCSLSQPPLPISQPPVGLLSPWAAVCSICGEQMGNGVPGLLFMAFLHQPFAARWVWVLMGHTWGMEARSQLAHGLAP